MRKRLRLTRSALDWSLCFRFPCSAGFLPVGGILWGRNFCETLQMSCSFVLRDKVMPRWEYFLTMFRHDACSANRQVVHKKYQRVNDFCGKLIVRFTGVTRKYEDWSLGIILVRSTSHCQSFTNLKEEFSSMHPERFLPRMHHVHRHHNMDPFGFWPGFFPFLLGARGSLGAISWCSLGARAPNLTFLLSSKIFLKWHMYS